MSRSTKVAVGSVALILVCLMSAPFGLAVKSLVDLIALGHSLAKTLLLLLFVLLLSVLVKRKQPVSSGWTFRVALLLPFLFVGNLVQYLWYCHKFGIEPTVWSAVVKDGFWSMSRLDHTHTAKAMLSSLPAWLATRTDVGHSLGAVFPRPLLWLQLALFLATIALATISCVYQLQHDTPGRAVSYVLASFVLVKCLVDGGMLIPEVWAAAPVFCYLVFGRRGLQVCGAVSLFYLGSLFIWKPMALAIILLDWLPSLLALSIPILWERSRVAAVALLLLVVASPIIRYAVVPSSRFRPHALNTAAYASQPLQKGWKVYVVSQGRLKPVGTDVLSMEAEYELPQTGFCLTEGTLIEDTTPLKICETYGLEAVRRPVSWYPGPVQVDARVLVLEGSLQDVPHSPLVTSFATDGDKVSVLFRPGVNRDLAIATLGPGLAVLHDFNLSYPKSSK